VRFVGQAAQDCSHQHGCIEAFAADVADDDKQRAVFEWNHAIEVAAHFLCGQVDGLQVKAGHIQGLAAQQLLLHAPGRGHILLKSYLAELVLAITEIKDDERDKHEEGLNDAAQVDGDRTDRHEAQIAHVQRVGEIIRPQASRLDYDQRSRDGDGAGLALEKQAPGSKQVQGENQDKRVFDTRLSGRKGTGNGSRKCRLSKGAEPWPTPPAECAGSAGKARQGRRSPKPPQVKSRSRRGANPRIAASRSRLPPPLSRSERLRNDPMQ
jgi:hypothetical protein